MKPDWSNAGIEPSLDEVMRDPIVHLVARRDRLSLDELWRVVTTARSRLHLALASLEDPEPATAID